MKSKILPGQIIRTIVILLMGIALGALSKFLDSTASNMLPLVLEHLDVRNFLGRFAIWMLLGLCIAVYSPSPIRAAVNVLVFFSGMVDGYYAYSKWIAGFFPQSYALIWVGFTAISPLLAWICWYAKGKEKISLGISAVVIAVLFNASFVYGWLYFNMRSILELITFFCGVIILRRSSVKETMLMIVIGIAAALLLRLVIPFHSW
jgi:hypothetical protein